MVHENIIKKGLQRRVDMVCKDVSKSSKREGEN